MDKIINIESFRKYEKGSLKGFFSIQLLQTTMIINDMTLHEKSGDLWVKFPQKQYEKDGETKYTGIVYHKNRDIDNQFQQMVIGELRAAGHI